MSFLIKESVRGEIGGRKEDVKKLCTACVEALNEHSNVLKEHSQKLADNKAVIDAVSGQMETLQQRMADFENGTTQVKHTAQILSQSADAPSSAKIMYPERQESANQKADAERLL